MRVEETRREESSCHYFIQDDNCQAFEPGHIFARTLDVRAATSAKNILECDVSEKELLLAAAAASRDFLFFFFGAIQAASQMDGNPLGFT